MCLKMYLLQGASNPVFSVCVNFNLRSMDDSTQVDILCIQISRHK